MPRFTTASLTYDRAAIIGTAWDRARGAVVNVAAWGRPTTLRAAFARELKIVWCFARTEMGNRRGLAAYDAETARLKAAARAAAPVVVFDHVAVQSARTALLFAEMSDADNSHALVAAARAQLRDLGVAA